MAVSPPKPDSRLSPQRRDLPRNPRPLDRFPVRLRNQASRTILYLLAQCVVQHQLGQLWALDRASCHCAVVARYSRPPPRVAARQATAHATSSMELGSDAAACAARYSPASRRSPRIPGKTVAVPEVSARTAPDHVRGPGSASVWIRSVRAGKHRASKRENERYETHARQIEKDRAYLVEAIVTGDIRKEVG